MSNLYQGYSKKNVFQKLAIGKAGDFGVRALFQTFAHATGLYGYKLPDMKAIASISHEYYNNDLRGGEGHMEVGKLIMNVLHSKAHMTLSVKPFGCMPSAGVSDGVQSAITEKFPGTIFCPVETSGDGRVNFYSRVQMYLFKAKQSAIAEYERALTENGVTREQVQAFLDSAVAPYITKTRGERWRARLTAFAKGSKAAVQATPHVTVNLYRTAVEQAPVVAARVKEDLTMFREMRAEKKRNKGVVQTMDAAAEE